MRTHRAVILLCMLLSPALLLVAACGSSSNSGGSDGSAENDGATGIIIVRWDDGAAESDTATPSDGGSGAVVDAAPARLAFPNVVNWGEPQMASPKIVTITFQGDTMATDLQTFGKGVTQSPWWSTVIADYCLEDGGGCLGQSGVSDVVGDAAAPSYVDTATGDPSRLPDGGVPLWNVLTTEIAAARVPPPDMNTIYMIYLPPKSIVNLDGDAICRDFDGYHNQAIYTSGGTTVPVIYGVVAECPGFQIADVTSTSSHEIVEAATDGYAPNRGLAGWYLDVRDPNTYGWNDVTGGEVGDLCVDIFGLGQDRTAEGNDTVQRIWSTSQAALLKDPCIPVPSGTAYFNAYPEVAVFIMNVGDTRTVTVTGFSDIALPDWWVTAQDATLDKNNPNMQYLEVNLSGSTINDGKTMQMTVKLLADPKNATNGEADGLLLSSDTANLMNALHGNYWPFVVITTAVARDAGIIAPSGLSKHGRRPVHRTRLFSKRFVDDDR